MADIKLKDFTTDPIESKGLWGNFKNVSFITLDTSACEVVGDSKEVEKILEIRKTDTENLVEITTFGYVGRFSYAGVDFDITYRFGDVVLDRMISKVNDFDIKSLDLEAKADEKKSSDSLALKILYMNFIFRLEKLSVMGIPKSYERVEHHDSTLKGQIDINRFIKKDMPFQGKISSISHEQHYVQEIVDLLFAALVEVEKSMPSLVNERLLEVKNIIFTYANKRYVDERTIDKALHHKSIQNSLYRDFKPLLEISSYIIRANNNYTKKQNAQFKGLVFDVSLLWESYLYKVLKDALEDEEWQVLHEDRVTVYNGRFYERAMKPDIIIKNESEKKILVFDAKSKSMTFRNRYQNGGDLDRNDFFQVHTYMSYYEKNDYQVLAGGLLYPMEEKYDDNLCISDNWLGGKGKFIVDGIDLSGLIGIENEIKELIEKIEELNKDKKKNKKDIEKNREAIEEKKKNLSELLITEEENFIKRIKETYLVKTHT